jgi:RIO kinase 1
MSASGKERFKTLKNVFDLFTERNLNKLIGQGYIEGLDSPLSIGKEANIFTAKAGDDTRVVKIYRLQTCDFNKMYYYIRSDPRYSDLKNAQREVIFAWAHREFRNLLKAREAGVRVPTPYALLKNIVVMEFIGDDMAAQKVKSDPPKDPKKFADEVIKQMRLLYKKRMVHGDLSGFNILNHNDVPVFIDMSQSTTLENPNAKEYLERDVRNICKLFEKWGVKYEEGQVLKQVTSERFK